MQDSQTPVPVPSPPTDTGQAPLIRPLPVPLTDVPAAPKPQKMGPPPHFLAAFFFSMFLGVFGVDRFYLRRYGSGVFKLLTFGGFGIQAIVDLALIMNNALRDKYERPLVGYEEYKGLAKKTVFWTTIIVGAFIILNVGLLALSIISLMNSFKDGIPGLPTGAGGTDLNSLGL